MILTFEVRRVPEKLGRLCCDVAAIFLTQNNLATIRKIFVVQAEAPVSGTLRFRIVILGYADHKLILTFAG